MKISYDPEIDALYIRLREGRHECRTVRLSEEVALNIGEGEKLERYGEVLIARPDPQALAKKSLPAANQGI